MKLEKTIDRINAENKALTKTGNFTIWTTLIGAVLLGAVPGIPTFVLLLYPILGCSITVNILNKRHDNSIEIMSLDKDG
jgi:uncharacterized protein YqgC (DUF456 family)